MTGTPIDGGWLHIEYEHHGVRSVSSYAMVLDATGVPLALIWTSMMPALEMQGTRSSRSSRNKVVSVGRRKYKWYDAREITKAHPEGC